MQLKKKMHVCISVGRENQTKLLSDMMQNDGRYNQNIRRIIQIEIPSVVGLECLLEEDG